MTDESIFHVTLGDFSGPLDLLCHLVESREMDVSSVKLTDVLSQYVSYLLIAQKASLAELAEFFSLASRLLLRKVRSLLPRVDGSEDAASEYADEDDADLLADAEMDEAALQALIERFKPYRAAAAKLMCMKDAREKSFVRISDEGGPPWFDIGDLYGLSRLWWSLIEEHSRQGAAETESGFMLEIPDAVPEEVLVERRMDEVHALLREFGRTTLRELLGHFPSGSLIVTLLALLEMSRLGKLDLLQAHAWEDVEIAIA